MEKNIIDINYLHLFLGYIAFLVPLFVFWYFKTGLVKDAVISLIRMSIQLFLVGFYLEYLFEWNNHWVNILWVLLMLVIATYTIVRRSELRPKLFLMPVFLALFVTLITVVPFFLGLVLQLDYMFESRYFIPITGIILGNCLKTNIIALNAYYTELQDHELTYRFYLLNGAARNEALVPFIRNALKKSFNPFIANMSVMGLIFLPGIMTGQLLGGSSPSVAIKYQIMIMLTIFVSALITVILTLLFTNRFMFDDFDKLKDEMVVNGKR